MLSPESAFQPMLYMYFRSPSTRGHVEGSSGFPWCFEELSSPRVIIGSEPQAVNV